MKFSKKTVAVLLNKLADQANQLIEKTHKYILSTIVIYEAKNYAAKNLPEPDDENIEHYTGTIAGAYKALKHDVALILKAGIQKGLGSVNMSTVNEKIERVRTGIQNAQENEQHLQSDKGRIHASEDMESYKKQRVLLILFGLGECIWNMAAFIKIGEIIILSAILGLLVGLAQIFLTKECIQTIKEIENERKKRLAIIAFCAGIFLVSLLIGSLRYYFVHTGTGAHIPLLYLSPLTFAIINLLFIGATAFIVYNHYPRKKEIQEINKIAAIDRQMNDCRTSTKQLEAELKDHLKERETFIELRAMIMHDEMKLLEKIDACYEQAVGHFKHENVVKRSDHKYPIGFKNPVVRLPRHDGDDLLLLTN